MTRDLSGMQYARSYESVYAALDKRKAITMTMPTEYYGVHRRMELPKSRGFRKTQFWVLTNNPVDKVLRLGA